MVNAQEWLDENYPKEIRSQIIELNISNHNNDSNKLEGTLKLEGFTKLEELNCYHNKLENLVLIDTDNLRKINAGYNWLNDSHFLENFKNPERLEFLMLHNNNFPRQDLSCFKKFINLTTLTMDNNRDADEVHYNRFAGSLEPLKNMSRLETLNVDNTYVSSGLSYLPKNCSDFRFNPKESSKSKRISKILKKNYTLKNHGWFGELKEYDINKLEKDTNKTIDNFFQERLFYMQKDISRFFGGYSNQETSELKDPEQLGKWGHVITAGQWAGRAVSVAGGSLVIVGAGDYGNKHTINGGVLSLIGPFIEAGASYYEKKYYEKNENKWDRFITDSKKIWNDYQELTDILEVFEFLYGSPEEVETKKDSDSLLEKRNKEFYCLKELGEIKKVHEGEDLPTKNQFAQDLQKNWEERKEQWGEIGDKLAKINRAYQPALEEENNNSNKELSEILKELKKNKSNNSEHSVIDIDFEQMEQSPFSSRTNLLTKPDEQNFVSEEIELEQIQPEQRALQVQPPYGTPGSSSGGGK